MKDVLPPDLETQVCQKVQSGQYNSPSEVIREALQLLDERDRLARLKAAIAIGDAQIARGEVIAWTPDLMEQLKQESEEMARQGIQPNPEVCP